MSLPLTFGALLALAVFSIAGCTYQSGVQKDYMVDQSGCQDMAERNIDRYLPRDRVISEADRNAQMVTLFSDCMGRNGWQVAKPKKADEVASNNPPGYAYPPTSAPNGSPSYIVGYPSGAATAAAPAPAATTAAAPAAAMRAPGSSETTPMPQQPAAPTNPVPGQLGGPAPATYQPVYGTGPGRNF